ncbi:putative activity regulator of membrane protease YbbK [Aquitalea magnusonii]|uniref:Putative activity regulator of membrane protease YbbK n=1 Tax=Aquitalea magnusonii TaxID=332411 RepID=A0A3G9GDH7_9NEIS|nr:NfeD family protein [Aquitalea magnusonii]BBF85920.1 putative activity regulator of membrane protease YbbK [Aquitalea magnusonii]
MTPTLWLIGALLALMAEFMSGTFYLLVIAVALAAGGIASLLGGSEALCWTLASLGGMAGVLAVSRWRKRQPAAPQPSKAVLDDPDIGQLVRVISRIDSQNLRVHYRGTEWQARAEDASTLAAGDSAAIAGRDGNVLLLTTSSKESR